MRLILAIATAVGFVLSLPACAATDEEMGLVPPESLSQIALTADEGSRVIDSFSLGSPPVDIVSNERFIKGELAGDAELSRRLVDEFQRQSGLHGEYFSDSDEAIRVIVDIGLYDSAEHADGALGAQLGAFETTTPNGLPISNRQKEAIGERGWSLRANGEMHWAVDVVFFQRSNLVVSVGVTTSGAREEMDAARQLARILDEKVISAAEASPAR